MIKLILMVFVFSSVFGLQNSCSPKIEPDERINVMSPDVSNELVFFFKKETTDDEIFEFRQTVIGIPNSDRSGYASLPGMMTKVKVIINGYDGEAINFQPDATEEEKAFVKKRVSESPLVYKVYENVVPSRIKDL